MQFIKKTEKIRITQ